MLPSVAPTLRRSIAIRATVFALAWLVVAGAEPASWLIGLPTVALATWASLRLAAPLPYRISPRGLLFFIIYFARESLRGGWDVAMRTMAPRMRIAPGQINYTCALPEGLPVVLFAGCVSLLPGTLSRYFEGRRLSLHLLDARDPQEAQLQELEKRIARVFGIKWEAGHA
jgi:multicomponent Na+:H+ antiporter subunit E